MWLATGQNAPEHHLGGSQGKHRDTSVPTTGSLALWQCSCGIWEHVVVTFWHLSWGWCRRLEDRHVRARQASPWHPQDLVLRQTSLSPGAGVGMDRWIGSRTLGPTAAGHTFLNSSRHTVLPSSVVLRLALGLVPLARGLSPVRRNLRLAPGFCFLPRLRAEPGATK